MHRGVQRQKFTCSGNINDPVSGDWLYIVFYGTLVFLPRSRGHYQVRVSVAHLDGVIASKNLDNAFDAVLPLVAQIGGCHSATSSLLTTWLVLQVSYHAGCKDIA